jgi:hypothetical protein
MSTRANVLIKDGRDKQWFYRHSDGYPSCTAESLKTFIKWLVDGKIRGNVGQGGSWLIILGNNETNKMIKDMNKEDKERAKKNPDFAPRKYTSKDFGGSAKPSVGYSGWKVGAYEITTEQHGDIAYLYTIDMEKETVRVECPYNKESKSTYTYEQFINTDFSQNEHGEEQI